MTQGIHQRERALYQEAWQLDGYADFAPGAAYLPAFLQMVEGQRQPGDSVLDAGTGSGKGALALREAGFAVTLADLTLDGLVPEARDAGFKAIDGLCLWHDVRFAIGAHDWVYCTDVLEHIPTAFIALVIRRLVQAARRGVFLSIALVPDAFGALLGQPLHLTVQPFTWWRDLLREIAELVECRDLGHTGLFFVRGGARG